MKTLLGKDFLMKNGAGITDVDLCNLISSVFGQSPNELPRKIKRKDWKSRVALVEAEGRGTALWRSNLVHSYNDPIEMVGLCDANMSRLKVGRGLIRTDVPIFHSSEFDKMVQQTNPDLVVTTTTDYFHADYAARNMELECDVLSEKTLATEVDHVSGYLIRRLKPRK